jgi:Glycosyltransferase family 9 (heptosyltransferase)
LRSISLRPCLNLRTASSIACKKGDDAIAQLQGSAHRRRVVDWTDDLRDFADTAALIANLDLIITVDTAVAHLAGALGKTVWVLTRFDACWRWLTGRDDSPWYPTARLWRQPEPGDWDSVVAAVAAALQERVTHGSDGTAA